VADSSVRKVSKLRASDGSLADTIAVGPFPYYIAFDQANLWVTNYEAEHVTQVRASSGTDLWSALPFHFCEFWATRASCIPIRRFCTRGAEMEN